MTTTNYKREFSFVDAKRNKVNAECEIKVKDNNVLTFSASGGYGNGCGQIFDHVDPANESQKKFIELWKNWHLNDMHAGTEAQEKMIEQMKQDDPDRVNSDISDGQRKLYLHSEFDRLSKLYDKELLANQVYQGFLKMAGISIDQDRQKFIDDTITPFKELEFPTDDYTKRRCYLRHHHLLFDNGYEYGSAWLTRELPENFETDLDYLIDEIEEAENERKGDPLSGLTDQQLIDMVIENGSFGDSEADRDVLLCAALIRMFDLSGNDLNDIEINDTRVTIRGTDYLAGTDQEMDHETVENVKDSVWAFNASFLASYTGIDQKVFEALQPQCEGANDAILSIIESKGSIEEFTEEAIRYDGRAHFLNLYDGSEMEAYIKGQYYFAYQN